MVEFAFVVPILFMVFFAAMEFSRMSMLRSSAENAAYEGARRAVVPGATAADATDVTRLILKTALARNEQITITPAVIAPDTTEVTVRVDVPLDSNGWITPYFLKGRKVTASCTLRRDLIETVTVP